MKPMRVMVTAAGAGPGVSVVKAIRRLNLPGTFVLAVDVSEHAAGLYLADGAELVPPATAPEFADAILGLCRKHDIAMIIPIFDTETPVFAAHRDAFAAEGVHLAMNSPECIAASNDKRRSYEVCARAGIRQPDRFNELRDVPADAWPIIGKPASGVGAKGIVVLEGPDAPVLADDSADSYLWQRFIRGREYSIDTWGIAGSDRFVAVPRWRRRVRAGQIVHGVTVGDPDLLDFAGRVCTAFGVSDATCLQVIRSDDDGDLYFVELNPRYGTGISLSIAAGVPFPLLQWLAAFEPDAITPQMLSFRPGVEMLRYWEEIYFEPQQP